MSLLRKNAVLLLASTIVVVLILRMLWITRRMETGWETIGNAVRPAAAEPFQRRPPLEEREPIDQADFWIGEIDRISGERSLTAEECAGAAWYLDRPNRRFHNRYYRVHELTGVAFKFPDHDKLNAATAQFTERTKTKQIKLLRRSTKLEPDDARWWRTRAILSIRETPSGYDFREDDWKSLLEECRAHDPDNALYDYLEANVLWQQGSDWKSFEDGDDYVTIIDVHDAETFEQAKVCFRRGQKKPLLAFGMHHWQSTHAFSELTNFRKARRTKQALAVEAELFSARLLLDTVRQRLFFAETLRRKRDATQALVGVQQGNRVLQQLSNAGEAGPLWNYFQALKEMCLLELKELSRGSDVVSDAYLTQADEEFSEIQAYQQLSIAASHAINNERYGEPLSKQTTMFATFVCDSQSRIFVYGLFLTLLLGILAVRFPVPHREQTSDIWVACWIVVAIVTSCIIFGAAPAEMIPQQVQRWINFCLFVVVASVVLICSISILCKWRQGNFRFSLLQLSLFSVGASMALVVLYGYLQSMTLPPEWYVPVRNDSPVRDLNHLRRSLQCRANSWEWAVVQWHLYGGAYIAVAIAIMGVWLLTVRSLFKSTNRTHELRRWLHCTWRVTCFTTLCSIAAFCIAVPYEAGRVHREFADERDYATDVRGVYARLDARVRRELAELDEAGS